MSSVNETRVKLERDYAIALSRYERAELATETVVGLAALEAADRQIIAERKVLREKMDRLSYLLRLQVDPEWNDDHIRPLHVPRHDRHGQIAKAAYRVLKAATEPMRTREIARLVAPMLGVEGEKEIARIDSAIATTLKKRADEGSIDRIEGKPVRWFVQPRKWVRPATRVAFASAPPVRVGGVGGASTGLAPRAASASSRRTPHPDEVQPLAETASETAGRC